MKNLTLTEIMTKGLIKSHPDMIMTEVSQIFETNNFHHLPVLDQEGVCLGVISKSDYLQLQDKFTRLNLKTSQVNNRMLFRSLRASEVMSPLPVTLDKEEKVSEAVKVFMHNRVHSIVITENGKCVGIVTPYDILKHLNLNGNG